MTHNFNPAQAKHLVTVKAPFVLETIFARLSVISDTLQKDPEDLTEELANGLRCIIQDIDRDLCRVADFCYEAEGLLPLAQDIANGYPISASMFNLLAKNDKDGQLQMKVLCQMIEATRKDEPNTEEQSDAEEVTA